MTTKERVIEEALTLFSGRGYEGVSVKDIAAAVNIKDSSLYKHFKSKKEIFDIILVEMSAKIEEMSKKVQLPDATKEDTSQFYSSISEDGLVELSKIVFLFYWKDSFASRFRRMLNIEQYQNAEIAKVYRKLYMEDSIAYISVVFHQLVNSGRYIESDPAVMAMNYYAPIFLLMNRYDNRPDQEEEVLQILENHVREFVRIYMKKD